MKLNAGNWGFKVDHLSNDFFDEVDIIFCIYEHFQEEFRKFFKLHNEILTNCFVIQNNNIL